MHRRHPALVTLSLAIVLLVTVLAFLEVVLRIAELPTQLAKHRNRLTDIYVLDPAAGYVTRPGYDGRLSDVDFDQPFQTNSRGLRGGEVGLKQPGEFRIVVLGDSMVFGGQVPEDQRLTERLEQLLQARGYTSVRVVNVATSGWATYNEAGYLQENISWLQPDVVVVAVFVGTNIEKNVFATIGGYKKSTGDTGVAWGQRAFDLMRNSMDWFSHNFAVGATDYPPPRLDPYEWHEGDQLPEPVGNSENLSGVVASHTVWESFAAFHPSVDGLRTSLRLDSRAYRGASDALFALRHGYPRPESLNIDSWLTFTLRDAPAQKWLRLGYPLTEQYLNTIRSTAASVGAPTIALLLPHQAQVSDAKRASELGRYHLRLDEVDLERPQQELTTRAQRHGIDVLDMLPIMRVRRDRDALTYPHDLHLTALGHAVVADALADYLQHLNRLPMPSALAPEEK